MFSIKEETLTDGSVVNNVMFGQEIVYRAIDEDDALAVLANLQAALDNAREGN